MQSALCECVLSSWKQFKVRDLCMPATVWIRSRVFVEPDDMSDTWSVFVQMVNALPMCGNNLLYLHVAVSMILASLLKTKTKQTRHLIGWYECGLLLLRSEKCLLYQILLTKPLKPENANIWKWKWNGNNTIEWDVNSSAQREENVHVARVATV